MKTNFTLRIAIIAFLITFQSSVLFGQSWDWVRAGYGANDLTTRGIALDRNNNLYVSGGYIYNLIFGSDTISDGNISGSYIAKYSSSGNLIWAIQPTDSASSISEGYGVVVDSRNNIYMVGTIVGTQTFGGYRIRGGFTSTTYLIKYSISGSILWAKQAILNGEDSYAEGYAIATDKNDNIYITGYFSDTISFGNYKLTNPNIAGSDIFLVKYDSVGNVLWAKQSHCPTQFCSGYGIDLICDKSNNIYLCGNFGDTLNFGSFQVISSNGNNTVCVIKYSPQGNVLWVNRNINTSPNAYTQGISIISDEVNNCYVTGNFMDTIKFGNQTLYSPSQVGVFLTKIDSSGKTLWAKEGSSGTSPALASDAHNHIYLTGSTSGRFTYENVNYNSNNNYAFILKLDTAGNPICNSNVINLGFSLCEYNIGSVVSDSSGNYVFMSSRFQNEVICGNDSLNPPPGDVNLFVGRWNSCAGEEENIEPIGTTGSYLLYPNPNDGQFNIQWAVNSGQQAVVEIYNVMGQEVYSKSVTNNGQLIINLANEPNGIYLCRLIDEKNNEIGTGKFVIDK